MLHDRPTRDRGGFSFPIEHPPKSATSAMCNVAIVIYHIMKHHKFWGREPHHQFTEKILSGYIKGINSTKFTRKQVTWVTGY
jgi:hypothetical protein